MAIYPKCDHTFYGVLITKTKTLNNTFALISIWFCFSLSSFLSWALDHLVVIKNITMIIFCSITWHVPTSLSLHTLSIEVSTRVSLIIQNQTRAFSVSIPKLANQPFGFSNLLICDFQTLNLQITRLGPQTCSLVLSRSLDSQITHLGPQTCPAVLYLGP